MNHNTQRNIIPGQVTQHRGRFFRAEARRHDTPCAAQCDCRLPEWAESSCRCSGFCYRWGNGDGIVFKRAKEPSDGGNAIIETEFAEACRKQEEKRMEIQRHDGDQL